MPIRSVAIVVLKFLDFLWKGRLRQRGDAVLSQLGLQFFIQVGDVNVLRSLLCQRQHLIKEGGQNAVAVIDWHVENNVTRERFFFFR